MMIAASEPMEFAPFGRQLLLHHPQAVHTNAVQMPPSEATLLNKLSQVEISDDGIDNESWTLRRTDNDGVECEEELYFKDKTVMWSIGPACVDSSTNRVLKCCYTSETRVQQALWCNFHLSLLDFPQTFFSTPPTKPLQSISSSANDTKHMKNCICILNQSAIKIFTPTGQELVTTLQFQVNKLWAMKYGLLLERKVCKESAEPQHPVKRKPATDLRRQSIEQSFLQKGSYSSLPFASFAHHDQSAPEANSSELPTLFSLSHPLDEICPVTSKNDFMSYVSNPDFNIIFTSESPSLCLVHDRKSALHAVYLIRKALSHESESCWRRETNSRRNSNTSFGKLSGSGNNSFNLEPDTRIGSMPPFLSARTRKSLGLGTTQPFVNVPNLQSSPFSSFENRTSSPLPSRAFTSISPMFSPHSISSQWRDSLINSPYIGTPSRIENRMMSEDVEYVEAKPLFPQICLQCVWVQPNDNKSIILDSSKEAAKAFITTDLLGQTFLCYLLNLQLHLLKLEIRSDEDFNIVGESVVLSAKDASPLESRNMITVIGLDGGVELYSGTDHVAKMLISGVSSSIATSSYLSDFTAGPTFFSKPSPGLFPNKRSSLLPQGAPVESPIFNESLSKLSPVTSCATGLSPTLPTPREGSLLALKDNVSGRISLEYTSSLLFRLELPHFGNSPLVKSILAVLQSCLPQNLSLQFLIKWYCTRNAPGCYNVSLDEEFVMFSNLLYSAFGYDLEALRGDQIDQSSPVTKPKKQKTGELQTDEDWAALIGSQHHALSAQRLPAINLSALQLRAQDCPTNDVPDIPTSSRETMDSCSTPLSSERSKRSAYKKDEIIDDTPLPSKVSLGKGRSQTSRFQKSVIEDDSTPNVDVPRWRKFTPSLIRHKKALLHPHILDIFFGLHLLYEDLKLTTLRTEESVLLVSIVYQLARDLGCERFVHHYWIDYPKQCRLVSVAPPRGQNLKHLLGPPPSIFKHLNSILLTESNIQPYPYIKHVNEKSKQLIQVFGLMCYENEKAETIYERLLTPPPEPDAMEECENPAGRVVLLLTKLGIESELLMTLPVGVSFTLHDALYRCRDNPGANWSPEAYKLAERHDLASVCRVAAEKEVGPTNKLARSLLDFEMGDDGMEELRNLDVVKLRWATDQRILHVRRMLRSSFPVRLTLKQRVDVSDHEFSQELERFLYAVGARTMALPVGRGMVTLGCATPVITEKLSIPELNLKGRVPPTDKEVDMSHIEVPANMNTWPLFHNGVAAGLRIAPNAPDIDSEWIIYNKPQANNDEQIEHAGFLMALGLNGHMKDLVDVTIFMYLVKSHEMTRVGLLLGIAVSKRGTMDVHTVKMVSVHIEAMLPPTGIELEIDVVVEPAALMALGFLYQGTAHRHIAQVLLHEIGRPPGPEMENSVDRESYSLAAGLALGLVVFGMGNTLSGLTDMSIPDTLHHFMVGGPKRPYLGSQRDKYKTPSFLLSEGPLVNTHVTGPGATLALGMLYFNSGNKAVAEWLKIPETQHLLETVLPDALLLRTLAKSLILWEDIDPTEQWVLGHIPAFVIKYCLVKPQLNEDGVEIDYETMNQAYCHIVAGGCMAIGLRYAGSANEEAFETLLSFAMKFTMMLEKTIADLCGRATIETCLNVITVSLGMVMAGTGNLEVMRLCRYLTSRVGPTNSVVTYGSHLATHMALGLLFLGGGSLTLSTAPEAIAALLCAFYPKWPICSSDNRYHLQALRHLYVLAAEPRLLLTRDIDTRTLCYAHVTYIFLDESVKLQSKKLLGPCLLPELKHLKEVRIEDDRHWPIRFTLGENWDDLKKILANKSFVDVKKRAGFMSYIDDPHGFCSFLAQTLTSDDTIPWGVRPPSFYMFASDPILENLLHIFFEKKPTGETERKTLSSFSSFTYFCLTKNKISLLPFWLTLIKHAQTLSTRPTSNAVWQWKLVLSQSRNAPHQLIPADFALSMKQDILNLFTSWEPGVLVQVRDYLQGNYESSGIEEDKLAAYLTFCEIPNRCDVDFATISSGDVCTTLAKLCALGLSPKAALSILSLLEI